MMHNLRRTAAALLILTLILGIAYPLFVCGLGQALFPDHTMGALIKNDEGRIIGSKFIGQNFSKPSYFHPRPSYAGINGYDASASNASNLGPSSKKLFDALTERSAAYRQENGLDPLEPIPADAVTSSGSGLDPHISVMDARLQANRVARERNLALPRLYEIIHKHTESRYLGIFGEKRVNVLLLNLAIDRESTH